MRRLSKRWEHVGTLWVLSDSMGWNWATIQQRAGFWKLDIWGLRNPGSHNTDGVWRSPASFATLREAKSMGRLLGALEMAKCCNF
jgi:hypothetical protein